MRRSTGRISRRAPTASWRRAIRRAFRASCGPARRSARRSSFCGGRSRWRLKPASTTPAPRGDAPSPRPAWGPYGAFLADGSEYSGDYGVGREALRSFHAPRWEILASATTLFACETLPSLVEAEVLLDLLEATPEVRAWMSFSCRDGSHLSDGTPIAEAAARCADRAGVIAVGVNCTAPRFIPSLIREIRRVAADLPLVVYPNSGETWSAEDRSWRGDADPLDFAAAARRWRELGATLIGGCCRTGPEHISALRAAL